MRPDDIAVSTALALLLGGFCCGWWMHGLARAMLETARDMACLMRASHWRENEAASPGREAVAPTLMRDG